MARMDEVANITALAKELGVERKLLYIWRDKFQSGGAGALHPTGRPLNVARLLDEASGPPSPASADSRLAARLASVAQPGSLSDLSFRLIA